MRTDTFSIETDQQIMDWATNYNSMLFNLIAPFLHGNVLEIGSGIGNFTKRIVDLDKVASITCFEISPDCSAVFKKSVFTGKNAAKITLHEYDFNESDLIRQFDFIFAFNVLEHIEDHKKTIRLIRKYLKPGARAVLYLPALNCLYGSIDKELGHFRRYNKKMIKDLFKDSNLHVEVVKYYNSVGALGWFYTNRILKRKSQSTEMVVFYDKYIFPTMNFIERYSPTFFGANLVVRARG
jgi:SAM-dependent methyltransferase